jgi:predicted metal-dependent HD superfamily phosphohydrolase
MVNSSMESVLWDAWASHVGPYEPEAAVSKAVFHKLCRAYSEPHRYYHNLEHLLHVYIGIAAYSSIAVNLSAIVWAGWFHDIVYDPRAHDNEERSAAIAATELKRLGVNDAEIALVRELILATIHADLPDPKPDIKVLLDADLAILGAPSPRYERYAADIRREYAYVPDAEYRKGRAAVLSRFLDRRRIFHTKWMLENHEQQARINLTKEIDSLKCD